MPSLKELLAETLSAGLDRAAAKTCSKWATMYRVMGEPYPGPWSFDHHPWLWEMHDCEHHMIVGQKAAQMGFTEWALNKTFYYMDIHRLDVLYILPSKDDAGDFSSARFDVALENSAYLRQMFSDVDNVRMKRAGSTVLYVRGSKSRSQLKSIPTPIIIMDEVDEMQQDNIKLAEERQSGQVVKKQLRLSTPTIEGFGINKAYKDSTQEDYFFKCPGCGRLIILEFPDSIVITAEDASDPDVHNSYYICSKCKTTLPQEAKPEILKNKARGGTGRFVPAFNNKDYVGYTVSQMYSSTITAGQFGKAYLEGLTDPTAAQEFYNSKLGKTFTAENAKVGKDKIEAVIRPHTCGPSYEDKFRTMGVDVGSVLHIVIYEWTPPKTFRPNILMNEQYRPKAILITKSSGGPRDFNELQEIYNTYRPHSTVIDAEPERRAAYEFASTNWGRVLLCDYLHTQSGRQVQEGAEEELTIKVNRTSWLDITLGRFATGKIDLPSDTPVEYKHHIHEPTRLIKKDRWGNPIAVYQNTNADHFAHASNYAEIALPRAGGLARNISITESYNV